MKTKTASKKLTKRRPAAAATAVTTVRDTFTVRDMNRQPQAVLNAARTLGRVRIQGRSGERFLIQPDPVVAAGELSTREAFRARVRMLQETMAKEGSTGFTAEGWETFSKIIAGEQ